MTGLANNLLALPRTIAGAFAPRGLTAGTGIKGTDSDHSALMQSAAHLKEIVGRGVVGLGRLKDNPRIQEIVLLQPFAPVAVKQRILQSWKEQVQAALKYAAEDGDAPGHGKTIDVFHAIDILVTVLSQDKNPTVRQQAFQMFQSVMECNPYSDDDNAVMKVIDVWGRVFQASPDEKIRAQAMISMTCYILQGFMGDNPRDRLASAFIQILEYVSKSKDLMSCYLFFHSVLTEIGFQEPVLLNLVKIALATKVTEIAGSPYAEAFQKLSEGDKG